MTEKKSQNDDPGGQEQAGYFQDDPFHEPEPGVDADGSGSSADGAEPADNEGSQVDQELAKLREALLRTRAEMDNVQKRAERELDKARKFATESLLRDLVPVIDSLDQGMESGDGDHAGLALTHKLLMDTLVRHGLELIDPVGEAFDPQWHEAMSMQPSEEHAPDTVLIVLQKGYSLRGRVVRPARVIVSR